MNRLMADAFSNSTLTIDLQHRGRDRYIAGCLLDGHGELALLDPGPSATLDILRRELRTRGVEISDIRSILLTHIHLDHCGATGTLVEENPRIQVFVHRKGAAHLADPTRLLKSASMTLGADVSDYWGPMIPVPIGNIVELKGGEEIAVGNRTFDVLYTPGHASHHVTFMEAASEVAFVGDAAGVRIGNSLVYPATPPSDIHLPDFDESLNVILRRKPKALFLTHFGLVDRAEWHMADLRERLGRWSDFVYASLDRPGDDSLHAAEFSEMVSAELRSVLSVEDAAWFSRLMSTHQNWYGLARYWRRERKVT